MQPLSQLPLSHTSTDEVMRENDLAVEGWGEKETCTKGVSNCQKEGDWVKQYRELMLFCCVGVYS